MKIAKWFPTPNECLCIACGPMIDFEASEFRRNGWNFIREHFHEYQRRRWTKQDVKPVFSRADKKILANSLALEIWRDPNGVIEIVPCAIQKLTLTGLEIMSEKRRSIPFTASEDTFWTAFDEVLEEARKREDSDP